jgi:polyisoprenoid-binding protein YceI
MMRRACLSLLALGMGISGCKANGQEADAEKAPAAVAAAPSPTLAPLPAAPRAVDPGSLHTLALDPSASKFDFVAAKITKSHNGSFKQFSGTATLAGDEIQGVSFEVDVASTELDDPKLTGHVKSKDFLDAEKFPKATFKSSNIVKKAAGAFTHEISGALTLHGVTQQISFPVTVTSTPEALTGRGEISIDRQKFGIAYPGMPDDLIKDQVVLKPSFVFPKHK